MRSSVALALATVTSLTAMTQVTRDPRPAPVVGTSAISGRVLTIGEAPAPVRHARVVITSTNMEITRSAITDDDGRFVMPGLPAGRYNVSASKAGWLRSSYGAMRPTRPGTAVAVAAGETRDLVIHLARGGVITGLVNDAEGRPARGVPIRLQEARMIGGERVLGAVSISPGVTGELTDDRGEYRLFGLPPGDYVVSATPVDAGGGVTRVTSGGTIGAVPIFFPGTPVAQDAQTVAVKIGETTPAVNFRLQFVKTARVEGRVSAPATVRPQDVQLTLVAKTPVPAAGGYASAIAALKSFAGVTPDWTFAYSGVTPGTYTLSARVVERPADAEAQSPLRAFTSGVTQLWALAEVAVDGVDRSGLALTLQPGLTIAGRVVLQSVTAGASPSLSRVRLSLSSTERVGSGLALAMPSATPDAGGRFVFRGVVPGQYRVGGYITGANTGDWVVASAVLDGREALDFPLEVRPDEHLTGLAVTMSDVSQQVSGLFQDALGRPSSAFTVVLFPSDQSLRTVSRRIRTARPGQDGRYIVSSVPPGDYRLAAVYDITTAEANDLKFLETLVAASIPISIKSGERKIQNVKVSR